MTMATTINQALVQKVAAAMLELGGDVPPKNARALILAAVRFLEENSTRIKASPAELAQSANLSDAECTEALERLQLINAVMDRDCVRANTVEESEMGDGSPEGLFLHPDLAWHGDPLERRRYSNEHISLVLL
jgi:hypothetical protein